MSDVPDSLTKQILLRAPRERVWKALADSHAFGTWFGVAFDGPFVAGQRITGRIVPTQVDEEIAKAQAPHAGHPFEATVERIEPMERFSFRWHPYGIEPDVDYASEPTTLVEFELRDAEGGTLLTVTESGFDRIPLERRAKAFAANEGGWAAQVTLIQKYLARGG